MKFVIVATIFFTLVQSQSESPGAKYRRLKAARQNVSATTTSSTVATEVPPTVADCPAVAPTVSQCPDGWLSYKSSCYYTNRTSIVSWESARIVCQSKSADLLVINSAEEWDVVSPFAMFGGLTWIGMSWDAGSVEPQWIDKSSYPYTTFSWVYPYGTHGYSTASPCVAEYFPAHFTFYTNFYSCANLFYFMCERNTTSGDAVKHG